MHRILLTIIARLSLIEATSDSDGRKLVIDKCLNDYGIMQELLGGEILLFTTNTLNMWCSCFAWSDLISLTPTDTSTLSCVSIHLCIGTSFNLLIAKASLRTAL